MNPAARTPAVSVIVPHYNDPERLGLCLAALERQAFDRGAFEIIVADNASPQGEAGLRQAIAGRAALVVVAEKGAGPARNGGVRASRGAILAFTDCDCLPEPQWLAEGVRALQASDFVGGAMTVLVQDEAHMTAAEAFERVFAFNNKAYVERKGFTVTANLFCPRALFDAVGEFKAGVAEDLEWSHRARDAGYRIGYAERAMVGHPARRDWPELRRKWSRVNAEGFGLVRATAAGRLRWLLKTLALPVSAVAHTPKVMTHRLLHSPGQRLQALGMLYRLRAWRFADALALTFSRER